MSFGQNLQFLRKMRNRMTQDRQKYLTITIKNPWHTPFRIIPNAYKLLLTYSKTNGYHEKKGKDLISCFEKEYELDGIPYMDVYIIIE